MLMKQEWSMNKREYQFEEEFYQRQGDKCHVELFMSKLLNIWLQVMFIDSRNQENNAFISGQQFSIDDIVEYIRWIYYSYVSLSKIKYSTNRLSMTTDFSFS
jgi:hypothetical protein